MFRFRIVVLVFVIGITAHVVLSQETAAGSPPLPRLSKAEIQELLAADYTVVISVPALPVILKRSFSNLYGETPHMANSGDEMSGCVITPGIPNKRLVFAAFSQDAAVIVFEVGGYATTMQFAAFDFTRKRASAAVLSDFSVHDLRTLRKAVADERYRENKYPNPSRFYKQ